MLWRSSWTEQRRGLLNDYRDCWCHPEPTGTHGSSGLAAGRDFSWDCVELYRVLIQVSAGFCGRRRLAGRYGDDKDKEQLLMLSSATRLIRWDSVLKNKAQSKFDWDLSSGKNEGIWMLHLWGGEREDNWLVPKAVKMGWIQSTGYISSFIIKKTLPNLYLRCTGSLSGKDYSFHDI